MKTHPMLLGLALIAAAPCVHAQSLEARIASVRGNVGFEFATRRNVCGNGASILISNDTSPGWQTRSTRSGTHIGRTTAGEAWRCDEGPARAVLTRAGTAITGVIVTVGGDQPRAGTEIGAISAAEASRYLLAAAPMLSGKAAENAIMGAAIADVPLPWRLMLAIARSDAASESSRKSSLFWVSQEAGSVTTAGLSGVAMDEATGGAVRSDALFYLAQRRDGGGIPSLIKVVRESKSAKLKKDAIFYLSQSGDPRALDLFEQLLAGR